MDKRQKLLAMQSELKAVRGAIPTKISGEEALQRRLSEATSPRAAQMPTAVRAAEPSYESFYIDRLTRILNSPIAAAIDITRRGR